MQYLLNKIKIKFQKYYKIMIFMSKLKRTRFADQGFAYRQRDIGPRL